VVADDNQINPDMMEALLLERGALIQTAIDGKSALVEVRKHKPDLVFLDFRTPGLNGLEVTRELRKDDAFKDLPLFILSADAVAERVREAELVGADAFLRKPLEFEKLVELLSDLYGDRFFREPTSGDSLADLDENGSSQPNQENLSAYNPQIVVELEKLEQLPLYRSSEILKICDRLTSLLAGQKGNLDAVAGIRRAVFSGDTKTFQSSVLYLSHSFSSIGGHS